MNRHSLLLPHPCKRAGWIVLGLGLALALLRLFMGSDFEVSFNTIRSWFGLAPVAESEASFSGFSAYSDLLFTVTALLIWVGCFLTGFSRCREEDEFTEHLRYRALTLTMFILMAVEVATLLFTWGIAYLSCQVDVVIWAPLFYVVCFHIMFWLERRRHEE